VPTHTINRGLPLALQPTTGHLAAGGSVELTATLSTADPGVLSGELQVLMSPLGAELQQKTQQPGSGGEEAGEKLAWQKEPAARCPVGASVVAPVFELRAEDGAVLKGVSEAWCCDDEEDRGDALFDGNTGCEEQCACLLHAHPPTHQPDTFIQLQPNRKVEFGTAYSGARLQHTIHLHSGCPAGTRFDLSYGPASEMGPADGSGLGNDDPHSSFLKLARIRVRCFACAGSAWCVVELVFKGCVRRFGLLSSPPNTNMNTNTTANTHPTPKGQGPGGAGPGRPRHPAHRRGDPLWRRAASHHLPAAAGRAGQGL
jgi:hypothetical protein